MLDISSLKNALTFATFTDGIPFIYYGTEQVFRGGDDPANREPLWPSQFNQNTEIYRFLGQINRIRSQVDSSFFNVLHTPLYTSRNIHVRNGVYIFYFARASYMTSSLQIFKKGNMVIAVTNSGSVEWSTNSKLHIPDSAGKRMVLPFFESLLFFDSYSSIMKDLRNAFNSNTVYKDGNDEFHIEISRGEPAIFFIE